MDDFRPRGLGEIIDRAISMYVRNFVLFMTILLCLLLPVSAAQYFVMPDEATSDATFFQTILQQSQQRGHQTSEQKAQAVRQLNSNQLTPRQLFLLLLILLVTPLATVATAVGVGRFYVGEEVSWRACWRAALRRWPRIIALSALEWVAIGVTAVAGFLVLTVGTLVGVLALRGAPVLAFAVLAIAAVLGIAWFIVFLMQVLLAFSFALYAVAIEDLSVFQAFGSGFARVFNRSAFWRSVLVTLIAAAVEIGIIVLSLAGELLLASLWHNHALNLLYGTLIEVVFTGFLTVYIAVYYFDVRTRAEGLDLQARLQSVHGVLGTP